MTVGSLRNLTVSIPAYADVVFVDEETGKPLSPSSAHLAGTVCDPETGVVTIPDGAVPRLVIGLRGEK